jgi:hypothetical protein
MVKIEKDQDTLQAIIRAMLAEVELGKSIPPTDVAKRAGGDPMETRQWRPLLRNVCLAAAMLQDAGELVAMRKGKPVDIREAKGVIRYASPTPDAAPALDAQP